MITSIAWRSSNGAAQGGVGILIDSLAESNLSTTEPITPRIFKATFSGNPALTVIVHYAPIEGSKDAEEHFENLSAAINRVLKHNVLIECGDFNAHIGKEDAKYTYHDTTNSNGKLMLDHAYECNLCITNTYFQKRNGKLWTFISDMNGLKSMIDYILANNKWRNSIHNSEGYNFYSSCGGDHRVVVSKLRLSLRKRQSTPRKVKYDWSKLKDETVQERYTVTIRNKFDALRIEGETINQQYDRFIKANNETAEELIPKVERNRKSMISNEPEVIEARKHVQAAFENYINKNDEESHETLRARKSDLQEIYLSLQERELNNLVSKVEEANTQNKMKESWQLINKITNRKSSKQGMIKGASKAERVNNQEPSFLCTKCDQTSSFRQSLSFQLQEREGATFYIE